jgi:hypothetical protein
MNVGNKLVFVIGMPFRPSLMFVGKARSLPWSGALESFATDSSLLQIFVHYGRKTFYKRALLEKK